MLHSRKNLFIFGVSSFVLSVFNVFWNRGFILAFGDYDWGLWIWNLRIDLKINYVRYILLLLSIYVFIYNKEKKYRNAFDMVLVVLLTGISVLLLFICVLLGRGPHYYEAFYYKSFAELVSLLRPWGFVLIDFYWTFFILFLFYKSKRWENP